jgi:hypothetical protein
MQRKSSIIVKRHSASKERIEEEQVQRRRAFYRAKDCKPDPSVSTKILTMKKIMIIDIKIILNELRVRNTKIITPDGERYFTAEERTRATEVHPLCAKLGHPGIKALKRALDNGN